MCLCVCVYVRYLQPPTLTQLAFVYRMCSLNAIVCVCTFFSPGGIGWGQNMKFKMGLNMMDMVGKVYARLSDVQFPFLIMHDPGDGEHCFLGIVVSFTFVIFHMKLPSVFFSSFFLSLVILH